jgi:polysaccharide export outer membrane protein
MKTHFTTAICALLLWAFSSAPAGAQTNYVLGVQDVVTVTVVGEPDLSRKFTIEQDGTFTFPYIGRVLARGLTPRQLEEELKKKLSGDYLRNPQITVSVDAYRSQKILIMGEVLQPGEYQLTGDMTLLSAIAKAGSVRPSAGREITIVRAPAKRGSNGNGHGESEILKIDLAALQSGDLSLNVPLQDGDTINVPKAQSVFVSGQVKSPGGYAVEPGMTVLQVLSLAGGVTDRGSTGRIQILRTVDGKQKELKAKLTDKVLPGDTIVVKERIF